MIVDDSGLEAIRKATEVETPDLYRLRVAVVADSTGGGGALTSCIATNVTVSTTEVPIRVGGSNLAGRKLISVSNYSSSIVFLGPTGVTSTSGVKVFKNATKYIEAGPALNLFLIRASGSGDVHIEEFA